MQELKQGTPLQGGKYIIKRVLGQGGFGITYLAEQVSLGREVAIKEFFMKDGCLRNEETGFVTVPTTGAAARVEQFRKKFLKEARTLASMDHPHIISVIDVFEENGTVYYSMPYIPNGSLKSLVQKKGRLNESAALLYIGQVASALEYMHERQLCHYDVKPDNILLDSRGNAILIDFGISKNYDADGNETSTTPIGISEGFAPIEQYQGISGFSPASDIYSLGASLYFLTMGQTPVSAIDRVQGKELTFNDELSAGIQSLIKQSMELQYNKRPEELSLFTNVKTANQEQYEEATLILPKGSDSGSQSSNSHGYISEMMTSGNNSWEISELASGLWGNIKYSDNVFRQLRSRFPWLFISLVAGIICVLLLGGSKGDATLLRILPGLALFIPLIGNMGGIVSIQSSAIVVQGLVDGDLSFKSIGKHFLKEFSIALINAFVIGLLFFSCTRFFPVDDDPTKSSIITAAVMASLFLTMMSASLFGTLLPLVLKKYKINFIVATSPFITMTNDIIGMAVYMAVCAWLINVFTSFI